ncbi:ppGpp synthetase/RelA/SpoT-type nucleotidyltransferase [Tenacibaculum lutimaris]|uniref:PpGpp synthetase/RelA/SpoT-type nucleotidyltransferase n=1 Tax=Tenacibaculum lutimaris TaxID=285258 RepID=A0A420DZ53_9FLAO|nr:hypothetical protein [Tenacibaculum lutimaris]RKF03098.1 ppGpp synthetase/RelA/SpoT-type nucleotidyltransferase [Tenacibaculum lutimaris]
MAHKNIDEKVWLDNAKTIKQFIDQRHIYEQLCDEIAFVLKFAMEESDLEYSAISKRSKTLNSFLEKITRKKYKDPFSEITDFAGVRLVFLYNSDFDKIEKIVKDNFKIIEKVDKLNDKGVDKFGYGAIHYIVQLNKNHAGARYDNLVDKNCEIQIRTVLQDAWSIIDHHLVYKNTSSVPKELRRKLNSLAGLFETADDQFNQLREMRETYIKNVDKSKSSPDEFLNTELNLDSFKQYISWKFPKLPLETFDDQSSIAFKELINAVDLSKLLDLDNLVNKGIKKFEQKQPKFDDHPNFHSSSVATIISVGLTNKKLMSKMGIPNDWKELLE